MARELEAEPFILFPRNTAPLLFDLIIEEARLAGAQLNIAREGRDWLAVLGLVRAEAGISFVPASLGRPRPGGAGHPRGGGPADEHDAVDRLREGHATIRCVERFARSGARLTQAMMVRTVGIEPTLPMGEEDFKSPASTVPPRPLVLSDRAQRSSAKRSRKPASLVKRGLTSWDLLP